MGRRSIDPQGDGRRDRGRRLSDKGDGRRPGDPIHVPTGPLWGQEHPTFSEYFHGDTGAGLGASHQAGWTAIVAHLICTTNTDAHTEREHA